MVLMHGSLISSSSWDAFAADGREEAPFDFLPPETPAAQRAAAAGDDNAAWDPQHWGGESEAAADSSAIFVAPPSVDPEPETVQRR